VETDSREILKVRNWKRESLDRQIWRCHLNKAKDWFWATVPIEKEEKVKILFL
jgi:hypothetical protein